MDFEETLSRMHHRQLYFCTNEKLMQEQTECLERLYEFNQTRPSEGKKRQELLREMFAEIGDNCYIEPPLHANWGGKHVHFGHDVYANFNLTLVDDTHIYVGNYVMFAPNVILATGTHPIHPELRQKVAQYNLPIIIEDNVWIGAGSIVLPGVTIGKNSVIGAGSLVTKDIPANVVAMGSPCQVVREISERDYQFYYKNMEIDL